MNAAATPPPGDADDPVPALIRTLRLTQERLQELTAGEVDAVIDRDGSTFLLQRSQVHQRRSESTRQTIILNALPTHIALLDSRGVIVAVNDAWLEFSDGSVLQGSDCVVGADYAGVCNGAVGEGAAEAHQAGAGILSVLSGASGAFSLEYACHSGPHRRWFLLNVTALAAGGAGGAVVMHSNITERKLAEETLRRASGRVARSRTKGARLELLALVLVAASIYLLADRYGWLMPLRHWIVLEHTLEHVGEIVFTFVFLATGLGAFAYRRWRESESALTGSQQAQAAMELLHHELERRVKQRTVELAAVNQALATELRERLLATDALRASEQLFRQLAENIRSAFFLTDPTHTRMLYVSPGYAEIWGKSTQSLYDSPQTWLDSIHPDDLPAVLAGNERRNTEGRFEYEFRIVRPDASTRWIRSRGFPILDAAGRLYRVAGLADDITEQRAGEVRIRFLNRVYAVLSGINTLILRVSGRSELFREACRVAVEGGGFRMAWIGMVEPGGPTLVPVASAGMSHADSAALSRLLAVDELAPSCLVARALRDKTPAVTNHSASDPAVVVGPIGDDSLFGSKAVLPLVVANEAVGVLALYAGEADFFHEEEMKLLAELAGDISFSIDNIDKSHRMDYLAYFDALTGLPNASLFHDRLDQFVQVVRQEGGKVCVVVADLDRFTQVNDTLGRSAGDELLRQVAQRLGQFLVEPYALGRIGADTFAVASPRGGGVMATLLYDTVLEAFNEPFAVRGREVSVGVHVGIALFPADGADGDSVFTNAEAALKLAKTSGERFRYHSSELNARTAERFVLEGELRAAVDAREFVLHYQPRVDMINGHVVGAEALIRWRHPRRGLLPPGQFIALAEESGLIVAIGAWAIDAVCAQQAAWRSTELSIVPIAVNLSSVQFEKCDVLKTVSEALAAHSLAPAMLDLELTESAMMIDPATAADTLQALRKLGVGLALDDFGTGYSSLAHLKHFPFDSVKIDRSFVMDITSNPEDAAIASAIIAMAHRLGLKVVAEGVETQGQFNYLRAQGCDEMQGYLFSPPLADAAYEAQLRGNWRMALPATEPADQRTLLVVDDEPGMRSALNRVMRRDGYRVLTAAGGAEALEILAVNAVQVIISDQRMPEMSGTAFLNTVKQLYPETMRIILSGYTDLAIVTDSVNRGAVFKFLTKPWDDDLLREQVRDAFRRYRPENRTGTMPLATI